MKVLNPVYVRLYFSALCEHTTFLPALESLNTLLSAYKLYNFASIDLCLVHVHSLL